VCPHQSVPLPLCLTDALTEGNILDDSDLTLLRAYALKVEECLTDKAFNKLRFAFLQSPIDSLKNTEKHVQFLSGFQPMCYHCCPFSCVCYTGLYESLNKCPKCNIDQYKVDGMTPQAIFEYIPIIPHPLAMLTSSSYARKMQYRSKCKYDPTTITDIFDGTQYHSLLETFITISNEELPTWYFSNLCDIALGLSSDGFGPFKCHTKTAWPIILFNYNLPPEEWFLKQNIIWIGVIPGPKKSCDFNSFLWPLVQELLQLAIGVSAFNIIIKTLFLLHAHLIIVFGDIPVVLMIMCMKGHNAIFPCRMCTINGVCIPSLRVMMHYVPLCHNGFPDSQEQYNPSVILLQNHASFMEQAKEVQYASSNTDSKSLATKYGIKGLPLLSTLSSFSFPMSFPYDFMHLIWTNLIPNLILFWTEKFKDIPHHNEGYVLVPTVWEAIGEATVNAGKTIPAVFGSRVLNIASEKAQMIAKTHSIWTLYIAPTLLKGRFVRPQYYKHFMELVQLLTLCLKFKITQDQVNGLERGFQS
jgi:hypothetical protein